MTFIVIENSKQYYCLGFHKEGVDAAIKVLNVEFSQTDDVLARLIRFKVPDAFPLVMEPLDV